MADATGKGVMPTPIQTFPMFDKRIFKENTPGEGGGGTPAPPPADPPKPPADPPKPPTPPEDESAKRIKELNEESKKHRLRAKELEEENSRYKKAFEIINGKGNEQPDPVKLEKENADKRIRDAYLKAAFVGVAAKDMHDADFAFDAIKKELGDVEVDLDSGMVNKEALNTKVAELKKSKPFLFIEATFGETPTARPAVATQPAPKGRPDGNGIPNNGNPYQVWQELKKSGRTAEAQSYWNQNRAAIMANMK